MPIKTRPLPDLTPKQIARFHAGYVRGDGCWEWTRGTLHGGYGSFNAGGRCLRAHRVSYFLVHGQPDKLVCHSCDNRLCVNPEHLWLGTALENNQDMHAKGRYIAPRRAKRPRGPRKPGQRNPIKAPSEFCRACGHHRTDDYGVGTYAQRCRPCHNRIRQACAARARDRARSTIQQR